MKNQQKAEMLLFSILSQRGAAIFSFSERVNPTRPACGGESIGNLGKKITDVKKEKNSLTSAALMSDDTCDITDDVINTILTTPSGGWDGGGCACSQVLNTKPSNQQTWYFICNMVFEKIWAHHLPHVQPLHLLPRLLTLRSPTMAPLALLSWAHPKEMWRLWRLLEIRNEQKWWRPPQVDFCQIISDNMIISPMNFCW